jgi:hypothetical protein
MPTPFLKLPTPQMPGAQQIPGTPGINPNAPDPRIPQGPAAPQGPPVTLGGGLPQAMQLPQAAPTNLSGENPLTQLGLVLGDTAAGLQGNLANAPSQMLLQRRKAEYDAKRKQFMESLQLADTMQKNLAKVPLNQRASVRNGYRSIFEGWAGQGGGDFFDSFFGDDDSRTEALIKAAEQDQGLAAGIAMGWSMEDVNAYTRSDDFIQRAVSEQDKKVMEPAIEQYNQIIASPDARADLERLGKDGITIDDLRTLNEKYGTLGPNGNKLTPAQLGALERNELALVSRLPNFKARAEVLEDRKRQAEEESQIRIDREKQRAELEFNTALPKGPGDRKESFAERTLNQEFVKKTYGPLVLDGGFTQAEEGLKQIDQILEELEGVPLKEVERRLVAGEITPDRAKKLRRGVQDVSGPKNVLLPTAVRKITNAESVDVQQRVEAVIQKDAKKVLDAQYRAQELTDLLARSYDAELDEKYNIERLKNLRKIISGAIESQQSAVRFFEQNDTIYKYRSDKGGSAQGGDAGGGEVRKYKLSDGRVVKGVKLPNGGIRVVGE